MNNQEDVGNVGEGVSAGWRRVGSRFRKKQFRPGAAGTQYYCGIAESVTCRGHLLTKQKDENNYELTC